MPKPFPYLTVTRAAAELGISRGRLYVLLARDPSLSVKPPGPGARMIPHAAMVKLRQRRRYPGRPKTSR